jgi:hypothetical protein
MKDEMKQNMKWPNDEMGEKQNEAKHKIKRK